MIHSFAVFDPLRLVDWLLTYALHSTILLGVVFLLTRTLGRSPRCREQLWKTALFGGIASATCQVGFGVHGLGGRITFLQASVPAARASTPLGGEVQNPRCGNSFVREDARGRSESSGLRRLGTVTLRSDAKPEPPPDLKEMAQSWRHAQRGRAGEQVRETGAANLGLILDGAKRGRSPPASSGRGVASSPVAAAGEVGQIQEWWRTHWPLLVVVSWASISFLLVLRFVYAKLRLAYQLRFRTLLREGSLLRLFHQLLARAKVQRAVRLSRSDQLPGPVSLSGAEICVPNSVVDEMNAEAQEGILAHELAHVVRRDPSWLSWIVFVEKLFFFQPLNRLARAEIQEASEYLCDDWATRQTGHGLALAKCLAEVASWMEGKQRHRLVPGMAEEGSLLLRRIRRLLDGPPQENTRSTIWSMVMITTLLALTVGLIPPVTAVGAEEPRNEQKATAPAVLAIPQVPAPPGLAGPTAPALVDPANPPALPRTRAGFVPDLVLPDPDVHIARGHKPRRRPASPTPPGSALGIDPTIRGVADGDSTVWIAPRNPSPAANGDEPRRLGVTVEPIGKEAASEFGLKSSEGLVIVSVLDSSAAAQSGLKPGDVLVKVNGKGITLDRLRDAIDSGNVALEFRRGDANGALALRYHDDGVDSAMSVSSDSEGTTERKSVRIRSKEEARNSAQEHRQRAQEQESNRQRQDQNDAGQHWRLAEQALRDAEQALQESAEQLEGDERSFRKRERAYQHKIEEYEVLIHALKQKIQELEAQTQERGRQMREQLDQEAMQARERAEQHVREARGRVEREAREMQERAERQARELRERAERQAQEVRERAERTRREAAEARERAERQLLQVEEDLKQRQKEEKSQQKQLIREQKKAEREVQREQQHREKKVKTEQTEEDRETRVVLEPLVELKLLGELEPGLEGIGELIEQQLIASEEQLRGLRHRSDDMTAEVRVELENLTEVVEEFLDEDAAEDVELALHDLENLREDRLAVNLSYLENHMGDLHVNLESCLDQSLEPIDGLLEEIDCLLDDQVRADLERADQLSDAEFQELSAEVKRLKEDVRAEVEQGMQLVQQELQNVDLHLDEITRKQLGSLETVIQDAVLKNGWEESGEDERDARLLLKGLEHDVMEKLKQLDPRFRQHRKGLHQELSDELRHLEREFQDVQQQLELLLLELRRARNQPAAEDCGSDETDEAGQVTAVS